MSNSFGEKLTDAQSRFGQLCVGIDPHAGLLRDWNLGDDADGLRQFALSVVEACAERVPIIKPQVSFFERFGAKGYEVLSDVTQLAHSLGLLVIADAKRGDIGTTMDAYLDAWFGEKSGLFADALTVSPYLGLGVTAEGFAKWASEGKGVYSLVATSNPQGETVQRATLNGTTLAGDQWNQLSELNGPKFGPYGAVIGSTIDFKSFGIDESLQNVPILAPGFGAQGALLSDARQIYGELANNVTFSVSRSVLNVGPSGLIQAIDLANAELARALNQ